LAFAVLRRTQNNSAANPPKSIAQLKKAFDSGTRTLCGGFLNFSSDSLIRTIGAEVLPVPAELVRRTAWVTIAEFPFRIPLLSAKACGETIRNAMAATGQAKSPSFGLFKGTEFLWRIDAS
jgi:hypothetical protein